MLGLFKPSCPVDPLIKTWVEGRLHYLTQRLGDECFLQREPVAITARFIPELFDSQGTNLQALFERVCALMHVDPTCVELQVVPEKQPLLLVDQREKPVGGIAGEFKRAHRDKHIITVEVGRSVLMPGHQVVTLAHELAHLRLHQDAHHSDFEIDGELLTDLTSLHHGFGVMQSASTRAWESDMRRWPDSNKPMPKYMTHAMFGWALAIQAYLREERRPEWFKGIHHDAIGTARAGLDYLRRTGDTPFHTGDWSAWEALLPKLSRVYGVRFELHVDSDEQPACARSVRLAQAARNSVCKRMMAARSVSSSNDGYA